MKRIPKINLNFGKAKSGLSAFGAKTKQAANSAAAFLINLFRKVNWQKMQLPLVILFVIAAFAEIAFAIMIYGFKMDNKATKYAAKVVPFPVAVVNFDFVTYNDYLKEKDYIHHFYTATQQGDVSFKDIDSQIIDQLIENKIVGLEALRNHVKVDQADLNVTINSLVEQNGGQDKVKGVLNELYGLDLKDFTKLVRIQMLRDKLNDKMIAKVDAQHILIRVDANASEDQVAAAKTKIEGILAEIKGGLDFGEAAKKYSEDTGSADQGGKLDPFAKGDMVEAFSNTAFATPVGEISAPVRTEFGWHIIKVVGRTGTIEKSFSDWLLEVRSKSLIAKFYEI